MKRSLYAVCVVAAFAGCPVSAVELTPLAGGHQEVSYVAGKPSVISRKSSKVLVGVVPVDSKNLVLFVGGQNLTAKPANLGTENVGAACNGQLLRVFTYEDLANKVKSRATWQGFAGALSGGLQAGAATRPAQTTFRGNVYSPYGVQPYARYDGSATTYDPAQTAIAQSIIQDNARQQAAGVAAERDERLAALQNTLRTTTIYPGEFRGGIVEVARPKTPSRLAVQVTFAGEQHIFVFQASR